MKATIDNRAFPPRASRLNRQYFYEDKKNLTSTKQFQEGFTSTDFLLMPQVIYYRIIVSKIQESSLRIQPLTPYEIAKSHLDEDIEEYCIWIKSMKNQYENFDVTPMYDA